MIGPVEILLAFALDAAMGDPRWMPHPVRVMGLAVEKTERFLRRIGFDGKAGGVILCLAIAGTSFISAYALGIILRLPSGKTAYFLCSVFMIYLISTTIALRGLLTSVLAVFRTADIEEKRRRLSHIVGRDTRGLDEDAIGRAAIESLAENTSDGVVAPLFYLALGGLPLAFLYKAVNTLDSMVGYKDEKYREFGWASARLDDVMNFIPARITGLLMVLAAFFIPGLGPRGSWRALCTMLRDGRKHTSPNSGVPEAAMAGALGLRLGGPSAYGGKRMWKPYIGIEGGAGYARAASKALGLSGAASLLGLLVVYLRVAV